MLSDLKIRKATIKDIDFLIQTIIEADKSGSSCVSSCNVFCFSLEYFETILKDILLKDYSNYEYSLSGFLIAELQGKAVGALGSWIEEEQDIPSFMIKANEIIPKLIDEKKDAAINNLKAIKGFNIKLQKLAIQLEYAYVVEEQRRKKIFTKLIVANIKKHLARNVPFTNVQTIMFKDNFKSFNAYTKLGFVVDQEKKMSNPAILNLFPFDTKVSMVLKKENILNLVEEYSD